MSEQHLDVTWETVAGYLRRGQSVVYPLSIGTERRVTYELDGATGAVSLSVELLRGERCPRSPSTSIDVDEVISRGVRSARVCTNSPDLTRDFHDLALAVAARIVLDRASLDEALFNTIRSWQRLIDVKAIQLGQRLGLHGELAVLYSIAREYSWETAIDAWVGPHGEVHDFALATADVEVKTTGAETRKHTVHGLEQLTPKVGRDLWCVSIQLARGGTAGRTLSESMDACLAAARSVAVRLEARLSESLNQAGAERLSLAETPGEDRWTVRSEPLALRSSGTPHIGAASLQAKALTRISNVTYTIDLAGLISPTDTPLDLHSIRLP